LALSSRNQYLSQAERSEAAALYQTLQGTKRAILQGERDFEQLQQQAVQSLVARGWRVEYLEVRNKIDLQRASQTRDSAQRELVILAAARLGETRLMDNIEVGLAG
jgi:pantoate--beta-alanine ligase